mgnify:CR=1 FL=1
MNGRKLKSLIIALFLLISSLSFPVFAQSLADKIKQLPTSEHFHLKYDKFKDISTLIYQLPAQHNSFNLEIFGAAIFTGEDKINNPVFYLFVRSRSNSWRFLRSHQLFILADQQRLVFADGKHEGVINTNSYSRRVTVTEQTTFLIDRDVIEKLGRSLNIEFSYSVITGKLINIQAILQDLQRLLPPVKVEKQDVD